MSHLLSPTTKRRYRAAEILDSSGEEFKIDDVDLIPTEEDLSPLERMFYTRIVGLLNIIRDKTGKAFNFHSVKNVFADKTSVHCVFNGSNELPLLLFREMEAQNNFFVDNAVEDNPLHCPPIVNVSAHTSFMTKTMPFTNCFVITFVRLPSDEKGTLIKSRKDLTQTYIDRQKSIRIETLMSGMSEEDGKAVSKIMDQTFPRLETAAVATKKRGRYDDDEDEKKRKKKKAKKRSRNPFDDSDSDNSKDEDEEAYHEDNDISSSSFSVMQSLSMYSAEVHEILLMIVSACYQELDYIRVIQERCTDTEIVLSIDTESPCINWRLPLILDQIGQKNATLYTLDMKVIFRQKTINNIMGEQLRKPAMCLSITLKNRVAKAASTQTSNGGHVGSRPIAVRKGNPMVTPRIQREKAFHPASSSSSKVKIPLSSLSDDDHQSSPVARSLVFDSE